MPLDIRAATAKDAPQIAAMAVALTEEISATLGAPHFKLGLRETTALCEALLSEGRYVALLASDGGQAAGFVGLSEGRALYAGGTLATMQEFYVAPPWRSHGVGAALIEAALAQARGWRQLEVCTPPLPEFARSLAFYEHNGFAITGGRKLKRPV
jgi:GNAT superfamily N-acetyltransferase